MAITRFREEYSFLSNFYPVNISYEGLNYTSVEAAFQACKTLNPSKKLMFTGLGAKDAKIRGRLLPLRKDWEGVKEGIMYELCFQKFSENPHLKEKLLATGDQLLVEGNRYGDIYWGVVDGVGENKLGKILMRIREELK